MKTLVFALTLSALASPSTTLANHPCDGDFCTEPNRGPHETMGDCQRELVA